MPPRKNKSKRNMKKGGFDSKGKSNRKIKTKTATSNKRKRFTTRGTRKLTPMTKNIFPFVVNT